jgi:hypothetical protein
MAAAGREALDGAAVLEIDGRWDWVVMGRTTVSVGLQTSVAACGTDAWIDRVAPG